MSQSPASRKRTADAAGLEDKSMSAHAGEANELWASAVASALQERRDQHRRSLDTRSIDLNAFSPICALGSDIFDPAKLRATEVGPKVRSRLRQTAWAPLGLAHVGRLPDAQKTHDYRVYFDYQGVRVSPW